MADLLRSAADGLRAEPRIEVDCGAVNGQTLRAPPRALAQALKSLLKNAQEASQAGATVTLRAAVQSAEVAIEVVDRGCGMAQPVLARAGEPFFTTKEPGRGMGLGLFLTRTVVERLGGVLTLSSEAGSGTRALLRLPLSSAKKESSAW